MLCDRVSVLKDGRLSGTRDVAATSTDELIRLMVGRDVALSRQSEAQRGRDRTILAGREALPPSLRARGQP